MHSSGPRSAQFPQVDGQASYANQRFSQENFAVNALPSKLGVNAQQEFYRTSLDFPGTSRVTTKSLFGGNASPVKTRAGLTSHSSGQPD